MFRHVSKCYAFLVIYYNIIQVFTIRISEISCFNMHFIICQIWLSDLIFIHVYLYILGKSTEFSTKIAYYHICIITYPTENGNLLLKNITVSTDSDSFVYYQQIR